jgi:hypothetical protein
VKVCQPASGCRVTGDFCRRDGDCCGADGSGLPGDGNVSCQLSTGSVLGVCRNAMGCSPQGNVCHYKGVGGDGSGDGGTSGGDGTYVCGVSSAPNKCCGGTGNSGVCQLDTLGVPRCNGLGTTCRRATETCASADDCCNEAPCVPDAQGRLRCYSVPDGGSNCVPQTGPCTINADCCPGTLCIRPVGSTRGVCGVTTPPPPPPVDGGGLDAGRTDGGSRPDASLDGAAPDSSTTPDSGPPPVCSEYGQLCRSGGDCCNAIPCNGGYCRIVG